MCILKIVLNRDACYDEIFTLINKFSVQQKHLRLLATENPLMI